MVKTRVESLGIDLGCFEKSDIHVHIAYSGRRHSQGWTECRRGNLHRARCLPSVSCAAIPR
ncbi:MAG: hypothetical protein Q8R51_12925 [Azonexus sp.]|nr:hypothetical protein [Azonexus sp.]